jgi:hypothetical protein
MTKNILNAALVLTTAGSLLTGCDFEQPEAPCFVQDAGNWYAKYDPVDEPRDANGNACTLVAPLGERIGVYKFVDPDKLDQPLITIRPNGTAALGARDAGDSKRQTALGNLSAEPDAQDFCTGSNFTPATVDAAFVPAVPPSTSNPQGRPAQPATTVTYVIRAMWPAEPCIMGADKATDPADACGAGSGLNPDFDATCMEIQNCGQNAALLAAGYNGCCVPAKAIPSFVASGD